MTGPAAGRGVGASGAAGSAGRGGLDGLGGGGGAGADDGGADGSGDGGCGSVASATTESPESSLATTPYVYRRWRAIPRMWHPVAVPGTTHVKTGARGSAPVGWVGVAVTT